MSEGNFDLSLKYVLMDEGGNDDDPHDHGGRTSRGITQREYNAWRQKQGLPIWDVWTAGNDEVRTIYHDDYWLPHCPDLPVGVDYVVFDLNVNGGSGRGTKELQIALGIPADGKWGPETQTAEEHITDPAAVIKRYTDAKRAWYQSLGQPRFLRGWLNRTANVQARATSMLGKPGS